MISKTELEEMSLASLYELLAIKTDELLAMRRVYGDYKEQKKDVELIQGIINAKKVIDEKKFGNTNHPAKSRLN